MCNCSLSDAQFPHCRPHPIRKKKYKVIFFFIIVQWTSWFTTFQIALRLVISNLGSLGCYKSTCQILGLPGFITTWDNLSVYLFSKSIATIYCLSFIHYWSEIYEPIIYTFILPCFTDVLSIHTFVYTSIPLRVLDNWFLYSENVRETYAEDGFANCSCCFWNWLSIN